MADEIAGGNYSVQITEGGKDEVSRLTQSLTVWPDVGRKHFFASRKNERLNQFAQIVSHDLKGPFADDNIVSWIEEVIA